MSRTRRRDSQLAGRLVALIDYVGKHGGGDTAHELAADLVEDLRRPAASRRRVADLSDDDLHEILGTH